MSLIADAASWALILAGGFFCIAGAFGILRFPDLYTRMHAAGVIDPFGVSLVSTKLTNWVDSWAGPADMSFANLATVVAVSSTAVTTYSVT